ncbi:MAG TPA: exopolysaccharide biosynthesis polyprenyl glycosylphosphotransferase [Chthoniobacterales bacterium]|jgi:exopolysaccharide biosynthesis polyprenyl glycosylphosphotransferase
MLRSSSSPLPSTQVPSSPVAIETPQVPLGAAGVLRWKRARHLFGHEWAPSALLFLLDIVSWILIQRVTSLLRGDEYFSSPFVFFVLDVLQVSVLLIALFTVGGYNRTTEMRGLAYTAEHIFAVISAVVVSSCLIYSAATFDQTMKPSRSVILVSFAVFLPVSLCYRRWIRGRVAARIANRAYLVIGSGEMARQFYEEYRKSPNRQRLEFVDLAHERVGSHICGPGSPTVESDLETKLDRLDGNYSGIILAEEIGRIPAGLVERLVRTQFQRTRVYTIESFYESQWRYVPLDAIDPVWPLQTGFQLARISPYHYLKRLCDLFASMVGLVIFAPFFLLCAALVFFESGRLVLYSQKRIGRAGRQFTFYKFRTMTTHAESESDDIYTRPNDPRITRSGKLLRKLRLDELPQLWNVFKGEMSLIGPRAEWVKCARRYETQIPFYHFRHLVKPGITGWAQVNYPYGESEADAIEKLKYDLYYIRRYSLKLDAMIALKTLHVMLFLRGR